MNATPQITLKSWLAIALLGFVWGGTFLFTEVALTGITPFWLAASRIGLAAVVMLGLWSGRGFALFHRPTEPSHIVTLITTGIITSALPFSLLAWGQQFVTSGFAGVTMASVALIVLPMAHFLVPGERMTPRKVGGFVIGFVGVMVLIGGQALESTGAAMETAGRIACIAAAACYAVGSILMRRLPAVDPIGLATVLMLIGAVVMLPAALIAEGAPPLPSLETLAVLVFLGLIPTAGAAFLRVYVVRTAGPVFMSLVNYQVPVWSVLLGALILSEPLPLSLLYAMLLILAGVGLSQYGALKRLFRHA
ncbi:DMT family transporter [Sulfitobacter sp. S0837]|uniref:DMT family transporter n=1 Tax=Sulfitobacter maritimus TaxID=2741719 RepID=UPI001582704C|nr:DMT family transporter [Sulfitobacter maritimus]NUH66139.1 DMT family transporter [Sulfitobacter maritimus]